MHALSDSHVGKAFGWTVEALVKFPNPKIAETTVREMKEKCLIMGDRYVSLLPVLILFAILNCSHYFNHIVISESVNSGLLNHIVIDYTGQWQ